jgi:hypothetical protein
MAKLVWDRVGERFYQTGVDRGVLYPQGGSGVAWNGLMSVNESPTGGDPKPFYVDGYKYMNKPAREEFEGSIEAFTYPPEFEVCDGTKPLGRGLYFAQQRRKPFSLSYRTLVGNDLDGVDHGYKLHLVYNALAQPSTKSFASMSNSPEAIGFSWTFSTKPVRVTGHMPLSHLVIDSTTSQSSLMMAIEDILYGSPAAAPRIPAPSEVVTLFSAWPELNVTDNGDGTVTYDGPDDIVSILSNTTFQLNSDGVTDNANGTFTATST